MKSILLLILLALCGCSQVHAPDKVYLPVSTRLHAPSVPNKPYLPIYSLTQSSSPQEVVKAYVASVAALDGYSFSLKKIIDGYQ